MNKRHAELLGTAEWAEFLHQEILSVVTQGVDLGDDLLEIGPGPGAATEWLRHRVRRLVAVELEPEAADSLRARFAGTNVEAVAGDATALAYPDESFDTVGMFTMLHHVPTRALQDAILAGALRALRSRRLAGRPRCHPIGGHDIADPVGNADLCAWPHGARLCSRPFRLGPGDLGETPVGGWVPRTSHWPGASRVGPPAARAND